MRTPENLAVEPSCHREQMLDRIGCQHSEGAQAAAFADKDQPYRCWLLSLRESVLAA